MTETPWWDARRHADRRPLLLARNRIQRRIRDWLDDGGFTEVDPAALARDAAGFLAAVERFAVDRVEVDFLAREPVERLVELVARTAVPPPGTVTFVSDLR